MRKALRELLEKTKQTYLEYESKLMDENVLANIKEYKKVSKQMNEIKDLAKSYLTYLKNEESISELNTLIKLDSDGDLLEIAKADLVTFEEENIKIIDKINFLLLPKDPNDDKNVIVEIRGAAGGDEANIFVLDLYKIYSKWADSNNFKVTTIDITKPGVGASQLVFKVAGEMTYSKLKFESGVHRVQRVPQTESQGRIHTSTVTVTIIPEVDDDIDIEINTNDLKIDTYRASGAGGQHINTTDSAVRITHVPTGVIVQSQDGRSQISNREIALQTLKSKLYDLELQKKKDETSSYRKLAGMGDRSEKIRTYNYPQDRVTDHRINFSMSLKSVLDGKINEIINNLIEKNNDLIRTNNS